MHGPVPSINDKFYKVGLGYGTMRQAVEAVGKLYADAEAKAHARQVSGPEPDHKTYRQEIDELDSKSFSMLIGALDGILSRRR